MSHKKLVVLKGGLGNQLFQFSFAHLLTNDPNAKIEIYAPKSKKNGGLDFALESLCLECSHIYRVRSKRLWWIDFIFKCRGFIQHRFDNSAQDFFNKYLYVESNAYDVADINVSARVYSGLFQNWQYVHEVMPQIYSELDKILTKAAGAASIRLGDSVYGVVHFRRGDLLKYRKTMGILADDYFLKAINSAFADLKRPIKLVVLTDDKEAGEKTFAGLADEVYGPGDVKEWEALSIMSNAIFVVTSNSTFSWWGGLLSSKKGGAVYVPSPWFLDWSPNPGEAFNSPNFKKIPAQFT
jgi:hypothetical protein